ncbi:MAG: addiction module protein [Thermodesulfobacteriota bacterium]
MEAVDRIIEEAESLPVEQRILVIDSLLKTLNPPNPDTELEWIAVAKRRLDELRSGSVTAVPGPEVFRRIRERFEK